MDIKQKTSGTAFICELSKLKSQQKYLEATQTTIQPQKILSYTLSSLTYPIQSDTLQTNSSNSLKISSLPAPQKTTNQDDTEKTLIQQINHKKDQLQHDLYVYKHRKRAECDDIQLKNRNFAEMLSKSNLEKFATNEYRQEIIRIDQQYRITITEYTKELAKLKSEYAEIEQSIQPIIINVLNEYEKRICPTISNGHGINSNKKWSFSRAAAAINSSQSHDNIDVKRFIDFLSTSGGHTGGWIQEEHSIYLRLKNKWRYNVKELIDGVKLVLTEKTDEDIKKHHEWYEKYLMLKEKYKLAIKQWKENKN